MHPSKHMARLISGASVLFAFSACNGPDAPASAPANPDSGAEGGKLVYSGTFADSGLLQIHRDADGISYAVQARIGSQAEKLLSNSARLPTLADVYRSLHGGAVEVPLEVERASESLALEQASRPARSEGLAEGKSPAPLAKTASESDFRAAFCKDIREGSYTWRWQTCDWATGVHSMETPFVDSDMGGTDRVYAMNATSYNGTLQLWDLNKTYHPNAWKPTLQAHSSAWFQWGGTYSFAIAQMVLSCSCYGELGLSTHIPIPYVR